MLDSQQYFKTLNLSNINEGIVLHTDNVLNCFWKSRLQLKIIKFSYNLELDMILYNLELDMILYNLELDMILYNLELDMILYNLELDMILYNLELDMILYITGSLLEMKSTVPSLEIRITYYDSISIHKFGLSVCMIKILKICD